MRKPQFKYEPNTIIVYVLNLLVVFFLFILSLSLKYNLLSHVLMLSQQLKHFLKCIVQQLHISAM